MSLISVELLQELKACRKDRARLNFVIETINEVGTAGFANLVRWTSEGLDRADIDVAMQRVSSADALRKAEQALYSKYCDDVEALRRASETRGTQP